MASDSGLLGKFRERLRNIRIARSGRKKIINNKRYVISRNSLVNNPNVRVMVPRAVGVNDVKVPIVDERTKNDNNVQNDNSNSKNNSFVGVSDGNKKEIEHNISNNNSHMGIINNNNKEIINKGNNINVKGNNNKKSNVKDGKTNKKNEIKKSNKGENKTEELEKIEEDLLDKIRESFKDKLDELDILESELYLISVLEKDAIVKEKIKDVKKKIDNFIDDLNKIITQYNAYRKNYYIDNILPIEDDDIVDDLINYRTLMNNLDDEKNFVKKYKKFANMFSLYDNLKRVKGEVEELEEKANDKDKDIEKRDKKYKEICDGLINNVDINKRCLDEIERQNEYFDKLMSKIDDINREEYMTYRLRGLDELIGMSLRYVGLLLLSPLGGLIPGIAVQTLATRNLIGNIRNRLHFEEVNQVHYSAIDYESELNQKLSDINYTDDLINDTLKDIINLKSEFMNQYDSRIPGYESTLDKINKLENIVIRNKNKVEKIKYRIDESKKINNDKLIRVREMNNSN